MSLYSKYRKLRFAEQSHLRERLRDNGCYTPERNLQLYEKHFKYIPNRLAHLLKLYDLGSKKVLDVGSGYGQFLIHFGAGSLGIELDPERYRFAQSVGLNTTVANFEEAWPQIENDSFDFIWACNVLEHTISPFLFLKKLHRVLKPNGKAIIGIPTVPSNPVYAKTTELLFGKLGYQSMEHTSGFTKDTASFILSRTGFHVADANVFVSSRPWVNECLKPVVPKLASQIVLVAQKQEEFEEPRILPPKWFEANL